MDVSRFKELPVMGILRGIEADVVDPLVECVSEAGLKTIEVTMNTPGADQLIKQMVAAADGRLDVGAGTVLTMGDLHVALDAGASFVVQPTTVPEIVTYCVKNKISVFPGALTPQEIYHAWSLGATMVKVFPAKFFGPAYFKEIRGPFADIELLACGGVNDENIRSFFDCGAAAVAFGGSIFKKDWIANREFDEILKELKKFISAYKKSEK
ncbi:MAG: bifunctional 4-hydroxy-2-oxoglutarate aldolase/2-dehydro-3-deoxy-phosphogluconate aldolase [Candidatus Omnitrophica bacterium]|nr:bifunctional 4-hydroxy-2-oxoglutarate aldolase/2-dehydro-3-deoxy-phosphogluconate aldolase [Candidatus Omnitrophota bacterium]